MSHNDYFRYLSLFQLLYSAPLCFAAALDSVGRKKNVIFMSLYMTKVKQGGIVVAEGQNKWMIKSIMSQRETQTLFYEPHQAFNLAVHDVPLLL